MPWLVDLVPRKYLAAQLRRPSGLFGRLLIAPILNKRNAALNLAVLGSLELKATDRVLEVGFGGGDLLSRVLPCVPKGHMIGADFSQDMVDVCAARFSSAIEAGVLELACASVEQLPFPDGAVDKACTVNTIYFWSDATAAVSELHRVVATGGRLAIGFAPRETLDSLPVAEHGFAKYEVDEVRALLLEAGFDAVTVLVIEDPDGENCCLTAIKGS